MTPSVAVVDYGLCNVDSVKRAFEECGARCEITQSPDVLASADRIVIPGVGAFPDAMKNLREHGLDEALREQVMNQGAPVLGICLGMHLLGSIGLEGAETKGLDLVPATVRRLEPTEEDPRVPHMGWNEVWPESASVLFDGVEPGTDFYFVHSFHFECVQPADVAARTPYAGGFTSAVESGHVYGVQFHPEKSQVAGFHVIRNFLAA